jgi:hypothetical protein
MEKRKQTLAFQGGWEATGKAQHRANQQQTATATDLAKSVPPKINLISPEQISHGYCMRKSMRLNDSQKTQESRGGRPHPAPYFLKGSKVSCCGSSEGLEGHSVSYSSIFTLYKYTLRPSRLLGQSPGPMRAAGFSLEIQHPWSIATLRSKQVSMTYLVFQ